MRAFLINVGVGFFLLDLLAVLTILFGPVYGIQVRGHETVLLLLAALCFIGWFLAFALMSRRVRIAVEWKQAHADLKSRPERKDSESKQARKEFEARKAADRETLWNSTAVVLLVLALASATVILLTKISVPRFPERATLSLWLMFVPCIFLGHGAVLLAQQDVARLARLIKKF